SLTSYGAFVDIGGVDGMVHITELSWLRIKHPSEVVKVGDTVDVYVKDIDAEKHRISLGYKKTEDDPWEILKSKYTIGDTVSVKVVSFATYGAFANVIPGIDGLIHISQIANKHIEKPQDVLSVGDEVEAKITDIDYDKKRVSLSIRALLPEEPVAAPADEPIDEMPEIISTDDAESIAKAAEVIAAQEDAASEE
ncbi:MAG: S1 RNA-binding domain-containing protein, partial [Acutalibacteraceae bacterium]|nr:S1 RNA-binding domain-containing protein [Acutalibacteraceae bacterium]